MKIPRMPKDELKERLHDPSITVIDVRRDKDESEFRIAGARLHDADKVKKWAPDYPKDRTLVLYCS